MAETVAFIDNSFDLYSMDRDRITNSLDCRKMNHLVRTEVQSNCKFPRNVASDAMEIIKLSWLELMKSSTAEGQGYCFQHRGLAGVISSDQVEGFVCGQAQVQFADAAKPPE